MNRTDTPYRHTSRLNKKRRSGSASGSLNGKPRLAIDTDLCRYAHFKPNSPSLGTPEAQTKQTARHVATHHSARDLPRSATVHYDSSHGALGGTVLHEDRNPSTPTVIVTPAYAEHTSHLQLPRRHRAASSIYSRCVDDRTSFQDDDVPPVPPIPQQHLALAADDPLRVGTIPINRSWLVRRSPALPGTTLRNRLLSARSTPLRSSQGWWNYILSPFSARSNASFWRSPSLYHEEQTPMLSDVQGSPRSIDHSSSVAGNVRSLPKTDKQDAHDSMDIYRAPSRGEAAMYYDRSRNYPSIIMPSEENATHERMSLAPQCRSRGAASDSMDAHDEKRSDDDSHFTSPDPSELGTPNHDHTSETRSQAALSDGLAARTMASRPVSSQQKPKQAVSSVTKHSTQPNSPLGLGILGNEKQATAMVVPPDDCSETDGDRSRSLHRLLWPVIALALATTALIVVLLVMYVPQRHEDIPVQAQWVNTTAFPPFFIGVPTIIQPRLVRDDSKCVSQPDMWSCRSVATSAVDMTGNRTLPDFRFQIRFRNDSTFNSSALRAQNTIRRRSIMLSRPVFDRKAHLIGRDLWDDQKYNPSPAPPSQADQIFIGNTTDNVTLPYDGEATPFFISLLDSAAIHGSLHKRDDQVYPLPNNGGATISSTGRIAAPRVPVAMNGNAVPMPFSMASAQPVRLYKRGLPDEHYGFYTYYDRSIILDLKPGNNTKSGRSVCTWTQSRHLVQIWTKSLRRSSTIAYAGQAAVNVQAVNSSANAMNAPGSFPYATTITLDRHGGDANSKGVFCRSIDDLGRASAQGDWVVEDRAAGGALVQPGAIPGGSTSLGATDGLIDGGTGGCACAWANW